MIKRMQPYAKFLKDLCTVKRNLNINKKKSFLTKQVSAIIENKTLVKYKHLRCPTILGVIGEHGIDRALLDLGASVNRLPWKASDLARNEQHFSKRRVNRVFHNSSLRR